MPQPVSPVPTAVKTQGWIRIVPGACQIAFPGDLTTQPYYVYARTSQAHSGPARAWGGNVSLCAKETSFALTTPIGGNRCSSDDSFAMPFNHIDTQGKTRWTTTFTQAPGPASLAAAREAGLARLLGDIGLLHMAGHTSAAKAAAAPVAMALDSFRTRMKMPKSAGPADLFDALETEALKVAAPAGYSVCNDTDEPVWAALGLREGGVWASRGWWKVSAGACARAITTPLSADKVYLVVERKDGHRLVSGKEMFCITHITFDVQRRTQCKERGLKSAGFAATDTRGLTGFAAHVSEDGLLPSLRHAR